MTDQQAWRAPAVQRATGLSYRRLDYLDRRGVLTPSIAQARGSGSNRVWSTHDVYVLAVLRELARYFNQDIEQLRPIADLLREATDDEWTRYLVVEHGVPRLARYGDLPTSVHPMIVVDLGRIALDVDARLMDG